MSYQIFIDLLSDTVFGRGDGVAGLVDIEVEHESATGLPTIRGSVLKGLIVEECANIIFALREANNSSIERLENAARALFSKPGSNSDDGTAHISSAGVPSALRKAIENDIENGLFSPNDILESLTTIRRQTSMDEKTCAPDAGSLRSIRVVLRGTGLVADLALQPDITEDELALLVACICSLRRGGIGRNRGRGKLKCRLYENGVDCTNHHLEKFQRLVNGGGV